MRKKELIQNPFGSFRYVRVNKLRASEAAGFTLLEVAVAVAVGAVILTGAVAIIYSILVTTGRHANQTVSLTDINRAAFSIKNDLLMAQTTDLADGVPASSANLSWIDYTSSFGTEFQSSYSVSYALSGRELRRTYGGSGNVSIVGRNIISLSFTQSGKSVTVALSSSNTTPPSNTETIKFSVHLRSEEIQ